MKCLPFIPSLMLSLAWLTSAATAAESPGDDDVNTITQEERQLFESSIRPVLVEYCYDCHSHEAGSPTAEYALDSRAGMLAGGVSGDAAIEPGDPEASPLLHALRYEGDIQMPPDEPLPDDVIADFERWIAMGAPDPRTEDAQTLKRAAHKAAAEKLWSLQPIERPRVPEVQAVDWPATSIDFFVLNRLEQYDLEPVDDADAGKLLRRVYFDLIGLPPSVEVLERFTADPSREHFAAIVDSLLNSPRFGERWGRHWLDLARYGESSGMEFNFTYPHAWPYRDYVIEAFNQDKPYDRFITEQLAGDLLPQSSPAQRDENLLGTGFLAIGPKRHNAGTRTFRAEMVDDQIRTTTEAFLGLTVGCARCHDHKFDPIPTEDYYAMAGIFHSTDVLYGTTKIKYSRHPTEKIPFGENAEERHERYQVHQDKLQKAQEDLEEKQAALEELKAEVEKKKENENEKEQEDEGDESANAEADESSESASKDALNELMAKQEKLETESEELKQRIERLKKNMPQPPKYAMGVKEGKATDTHVAIGGDPGDEGDSVPRGFLSAVNIDGAPAIDEQASGRLELARWIASPDNPLTARVMANRVWQHLLGRGLVSSVNNFGSLGEAPSHPELLDHLAVEFIEGDWSIKQLIRKVVTSRVYQLSTRKQADQFRKDPDNQWLWRMTPRRLEVEPLRDAMLASSGRIDLSPAEGSSVTGLGQQLARGVSYEKLNPESQRRSVYLPVVRMYTPNMFQEFDFAASSLVVGERAETTTGQQALFFLNNDFVLDQAMATAELLIEAEPDDPVAQIHGAYRRLLSRSPMPREVNAIEAYLRAANEQLEDEIADAGLRHEQALASFVQTLLASAEFRYLIHAPDEVPKSKQPGGLASTASEPLQAAR